MEIQTLKYKNMTYQEVIEQIENFTKEQKQQLGYYLLLSSLNEDKRNNLMQLFHYNTIFNVKKNEKDNNYDKNILDELDKYCGIAKGLWKEDAQEYINNLRKDDRF
ncbi:MAG: hypothetical protein K8R54_01380 [Bacteroidales bacterium]|nr:hypothetical protein [Bacteroidales bacterium]